MRPIVIVGAGNMGGALARGLIAKNLGKQLVLVDPALKPPDTRRYRAAGLTIAKSPAEIKNPRAIIFAVKPQMMPSVVALYAPAARQALVISIAAGTTTQRIADWLTTSAVVRAMPNTPASIGRGITALFATPQVTAAQRALAAKLMTAVGEVIWLEREELIDSVTAVSGSGPAYVFLLVEALAKAAVGVGLPADIALTLARKTVEGAGALLAARSETAEELRRAVASPGGTTEAALKILMSERGLEPLMRAAVAAATARGQELGKIVANWPKLAAMAEKRTPQDKLVAAALSMIETGGWSELSLAQLARQSHIPVETFYALCPDKSALLKLIAASIDIAALKRMAEPGDNEPARDRAFDAILSCFEAAAPYKPALAVIYNETRADPTSWLDVAPMFVRSAQWITDNARLPRNGIAGFATTRAIAALLAETLGVWLGDGEDLAKTMAHVDRRLRFAESWLNTLKRRDEPGDKQPAD